MRSSIASLVLIVLGFAVGAIAAAAPDIMTFPATVGDVIFNHKKHVDGGINCKTCHAYKGGKIKGLGKEWAHKVCRGCHEAIMMGPTKCTGCHA
ncbi:cytochrome c family protein [Geobacter pelophilus]|uniref:Cytochrome c family protein n=1 Tax=Geoanaerobacter pelophilus TaxID=60036 RepID=A0AAW4KXC0_9BACT|nr:cytochrome c3 family protein [Geoanaerobacter pelophilus]MBT0663193.1 cytochrome c family protein [Geoanaerobacter pelophilus]